MSLFSKLRNTVAGAVEPFVPFEDCIKQTKEGDLPAFHMDREGTCMICAPHLPEVRCIRCGAKLCSEHARVHQGLS